MVNCVLLALGPLKLLVLLVVLHLIVDGVKGGIPSAASSADGALSLAALAGSASNRVS